MINMYDIPLDDPTVWDMICEGNVIGLFQIESKLGQTWCQKIQPRNIEELSAVIALVRPGCLKAMEEDSEGKLKSLTQHYADRKNGKDKIPKIHPAVDDILAKTYGVLCVHEDTRIALSNGHYKKIKDILIGDSVQSVDDSYKHIVHDICINKFRSKKRNGLKITLQDQSEIILTNDHNILTYEGWKRADDLVIGTDLIACPKLLNSKTGRMNICNTIASDITWAYLFGQIVGDGHCTASTLDIAVGTEFKANRLIKFIKTNFKYINARKYHNIRCWYVSLTSRFRDNKKIRKTTFRQVLTRHGLNATCFNKIIPPKIFTSNTNVKWAFVAGYFEADGYAGTTARGSHIRHICSANVNLLLELKHLLLSLGITSWLDKPKQHLYITNIDEFDDGIKEFLLYDNPQKTKAMTESNFGWIPRYELSDKIKQSQISMKDFAKKYNIASAILSKSYNFIKWYTGEKIGIHTGDIRYLKINKIEPIKNQKFYDITTEKYHNFIGNGIVLHNCYQEQTINIAQKCAGFSLVEADNLRKSFSKKDAKLMSEMKSLFINKAKTHGVIDEGTANKLFAWIEKSNRYLFNLSHSISYAINSYISAYVKRYYPKEFYTSWLHYGLQSQEPFEEVARIANDAKLHDCEVCLPSIKKHNKNFKIIDGDITFGLLAVKGIGAAQVEKLRDAINEAPSDPTWEQILFFVSTKVSSTCFKHLIMVGAIKTNKSRKEMLRDFDIWTDLTKKEQLGIIERYNGEKLSTLFRHSASIKSDGGVCANSKRASLMAGYAAALDNPTYSLQDTPKWIADQEKELLGIYLTCAPVDECDTFESNCTCKEFVNNYKADNYILGVNVTDVRSIKIKNGKNIGKKMAYLSIGDASGIISNVVAFPNEYERFGHLLEKDSNILLAGVRDKKNQNTLIIQQVKGI